MELVGGDGDDDISDDEDDNDDDDDDVDDNNADGDDDNALSSTRGERERLFGSREREVKLKITFPFYGKGTGIEKMPREGKFEVCYPGKQEREKIWLHSRLYLKVQ